MLSIGGKLRSGEPNNEDCSLCAIDIAGVGPSILFSDLDLSGEQHLLSDWPREPDVLHPGHIDFRSGKFADIAGSVRQSTGRQESMNAAGAAVGALIGNLISAWIEHHRRVEAEKKELKTELLAYLDAKTEIFREKKKLDEDSGQQIAGMKQLDPKDLDNWAAAEKTQGEILTLDDKLIQSNINYRENVDKNFHTKKELDYALNSEKSGAKVMYTDALTLAARSYCINQFYQAVVGYFQQQQKLANLQDKLYADPTASLGHWVGK